MILALKIFIIFFLLPLGVMGRLNKGKNNKLSLVLVFGLTPLLIALEMIYLIRFLPSKNDWWYIVILALSWGWTVFGFKKGLRIIKLELFAVWKWVNMLGRWNKLLIIIALIPMVVFSLQELAYPVIDHDSGSYIGQSEALYKYKNFDWEKMGIVTIRGGDEYFFDSSIREGVPALMVVSFLGGGDRGGYVFYSFIAFYYYFLLIFVLLLVVSMVVESEKNETKRIRSYLYLLIFMAYSWMVTRSFVFSSKEMEIYFLAVMGLIILERLVSNKGNKYLNLVILGVIIGLNMMINMHGIIIGVFIFVLYFVFDKTSILKKLVSLCLIAVVVQMSSNFEFSRMIGFVSGSSLAYYETAVGSWWKNIFLSSRSKAIVTVPVQTPIPISMSERLNNVLNSPARIDEVHKTVYQVKTVRDLYLKAKLQLFINVGTYGLYVWFALISIVLFWKKLIKNKMVQLLLAFFWLYFFIVLDPLGLNRHPLAVVLYGSMKYSGLLMVIGILLGAAYFDDIIDRLFNVIIKCRLCVVLIFGVGVLLALINEKQLVPVLTNFLLTTIQEYKGWGFYYNKIQELFYFVVVFAIVVLVCSLFSRRWKAWSRKLFELSMLVVFVILPFLITDVGKIGFTDTLKYLFSNSENKMVNTIYFGDQYKVYFEAKKTLPANTMINNEFAGIMVNDDYFNITYKDESALYEIRSVCGENKKVLINYSVAKLCYLGDE